MAIRLLILFLDLFPCFQAPLLTWAYYEYSKTNLYHSRLITGPKFAYDKYVKYNLDETVKKAFKIHWKKILLMKKSRVGEFLIVEDFVDGRKKS